MANKITKREKFEMAMEMAKAQGNEMLVEFFEHELELLANKSGKGSAKKSEEHEEFFEVIRDILSENSHTLGMQCGAIAKDERAANFKWKDGKETSSQRVSSMLSKMVANGDVVKTTDKKVTYFRLA